VRSWTHPWIAAVSFFFLMAAALLVHAPSALGQSTAKHRSRAAADTVPRATSDEGISVRVIDGGKTTTKRVRVTHETTKGEETVDEPDKPDVPEPPEPPEPPDHDNDLVRFGQDIEVEAGKVIDGSVVAIGGDIVVKGTVRGDCTAVGGSVSVEDSAVVHGDAVSVGGTTSVSQGGRVMGSNVSVAGGVPFFGHGHAHGMLPFLGLMGLGALAGILTTIGQLAITLLLAWLCLLLARERLEHAVDRMGSQFGKSFLWGLVGWMGVIVVIPALVIVGVIAIVILTITIIGIPVAVLLAIALVFALIGTVLAIIVYAFVGYLNGAMYLGRAILQRKNPGASVKPFVAIVVGVVLILGLKILGNLLGFLGMVFVMPIGIALGIASVVLGLVFMTAGMGAIILTRFAKGTGTLQTATAGPAPAPAPGAGWYAPPPAPPVPPPPAAPLPPARPPEGGSSDAP